MNIPYITFRESDSEGNLRYYILQKEYPHILGVISYLPIENKLIKCVAVSGHHLYVNFAGTLRGNMIPAENDVIKNIETTLSDMAVWYFNNRIAPDQKRFKKHKIYVHSGEK